MAFRENAVLVGSTGVIGAQLPIDRIKAGNQQTCRAKNDSFVAGTGMPQGNYDNGYRE